MKNEKDLSQNGGGGGGTGKEFNKRCLRERNENV